MVNSGLDVVVSFHPLPCSHALLLCRDWFNPVSLCTCRVPPRTLCSSSVALTCSTTPRCVRVLVWALNSPFDVLRCRYASNANASWCYAPVIKLGYGSFGYWSIKLSLAQFVWSPTRNASDNLVAGPAFAIVDTVWIMLVGLVCEPGGSHLKLWLCDREPRS